jgi:hypothetical protein
MSLEDIYSKEVRGNKSIGSLPCYGAPPIVERDPNIRKLEQDVFQQLLRVIPEEPKPKINNSTVIQQVSFEDALKELVQLDK